MKSFKHLRENIDSITEQSDAPETQKLTALVRSGLFDKSKLTLLKRALAKDNNKMSKVERDTLLDLLNRLLEINLNDRTIYNKVKADTKLQESSGLAVASDKPAWNVGDSHSDVDINKVPPIVIMKRRAIRVFPGGQKVALYWADRLNKYISVPFESIGLGQGLHEMLQYKSIDDIPDNIKKRMSSDQLAPSLNSTPVAPPTVMAGNQNPELDKKTSKVSIAATRLSKLQADRQTTLNSNLGKDVLRMHKTLRGLPVTHRIAGAIGGAIGLGVHRAISNFKNKIPEMPRIEPTLKEDGSFYNPDLAYTKPRPQGGFVNPIAITAPSRAPETPDSYDDPESSLNMQQKILSRKVNRNFAKSNEPIVAPLPQGGGVQEATFPLIKRMVKENLDSQNITIGDTEILVTLPMAKRILTLSESMNKVNKVRMEQLLNESSDSFYKILDFAVKSL